MTVAELIAKLQELPADSEVIVQKDGEGNDYSPLADVYEGGYMADSTWSGERCLLELTPEMCAMGYTEEDVEENATLVVFLAPVN